MCRTLLGWSGGPTAEGTTLLRDQQRRPCPAPRHDAAARGRADRLRGGRATRRRPLHRAPAARHARLPRLRGADRAACLPRRPGARARRPLRSRPPRGCARSPCRMWPTSSGISASRRTSSSAPATPHASSPRSSAPRRCASATARGWPSPRIASPAGSSCWPSCGASRSTPSTRPSGTSTAPTSGPTSPAAPRAAEDPRQRVRHQHGPVRARRGRRRGRRCANADGEAVAGLSISMPSVRFDPHGIPAGWGRSRAAARAIEVRAGRTA